MKIIISWSQNPKEFPTIINSKICFIIRIIRINKNWCSVTIFVLYVLREKNRSLVILGHDWGGSRVESSCMSRQSASSWVSSFLLYSHPIFPPLLNTPLTHTNTRRCLYPSIRPLLPPGVSDWPTFPSSTQTSLEQKGWCLIFSLETQKVCQQ